MQSTPVLLNVKQACEVLGISERKFHQLRAQSWLPLPIELGPRCSKWHRDELLQAAQHFAPRRVVQAEPAHLAQARDKVAA